MSTKNTFSELTANRYALALYELANENSELNKIEEESYGIIDLIKNSTDFKLLLKDPTNKKNEQIKVIEQISKKFDFSLNFSKFLGFLISKRRFFFLEKILINFLNLCSKKRGEITAKLISSKKLNMPEVENIQKELSENLSSKVKLNYNYDPSLIGGLVIQIGSIMIDTSIKNKLKKLQTKMVEA